MPISVRLDPTTEKTLARMVNLTGKSRSQLIREAIQQMSVHVEATKGKSAYDRMADLIGVVDRGLGNRAARGEEILRAMFAKDRARRRARR